MPDLIEQFKALTPEAKRQIHLALCEQALSKWHAFSAKKRQIRYTESVAGTRQIVDIALPSDALTAARVGRDNLSVRKRYSEPITALQDDDWKPPEPILFAYYSIYNLFEKYAEGREIDDWLIVNQALSSLNLEIVGTLLSQLIASQSAESVKGTSD